MWWKFQILPKNNCYSWVINSFPTVNIRSQEIIIEKKHVNDYSNGNLKIENWTDSLSNQVSFA